MFMHRNVTVSVNVEYVIPYSPTHFCSISVRFRWLSVCFHYRALDSSEAVYKK